MNGILTDPRLLALQQAAKGKDPQAFRQELMARVDRGELPSSLVYVMNLQNRAELIGKAMSPEQQQQAMQQPSIRQRLENAVANAAPPPQMQQQMPVQQPPMMGGAPAGLPATSAATLARPGTFSAKGGGIVAFGAGGLNDEDEEYPEVDAASFYPAAPAAPAPNPMMAPENIAKMKPSEMQAQGLGMVLQRRPRTSQESQEKARKALADSLGVDKLNKEQTKMFKDAITNIAARRDEAKAMFFLEAGDKIARSTQGFLGAVATGFAEPAARLGKTRRELDVEERGVKGEQLKSRRDYANAKLADFDRIGTARMADEAAVAAEEGRIGTAMMTYGGQREQVQLARERMINDLKRSQGQLGPLGLFKEDIEAAIKALRAAKTPEELAAAQAKFNSVTANMQKLQPQYITGQAGINREQIRAGVTALQNAEKNPNSQIYKLRNQKRLEEAKRDKADPNRVAQLEAAIQAEEDRLLGLAQTNQAAPGAARSPTLDPSSMTNEEIMAALGGG
jgi:hypothetical protein